MDKIIWPTKQRYLNPTVYELKPEEELRIYEIQDFIRVRLLDGQAEVFGREMPTEETVFFFKGENLGIFTWKGAKIEVEDHKSVYVDQRGQFGETKNPMRELVNLNHILEQQRNEALTSKTPGPCVFVTGNSQSGKTSVCKILVNYALKLGWTPLFVDIDLSTNMLSAPGCLSAALVEDILDGQSDTLTAKSINYFHGACTPGNFIITPDYFDSQIA